MSLRNDAMAALAPPPIPAGWHTVEQIADKEGLSRTHAQHLLLRVVKAGTWERKPWRIMSSGVRVKAFIYREKPGKNRAK